MNVVSINPNAYVVGPMTSARTRVQTTSLTSAANPVRASVIRGDGAWIVAAAGARRGLGAARVSSAAGR